MGLCLYMVCARTRTDWKDLGMFTYHVVHERYVSLKDWNIPNLSRPRIIALKISALCFFTIGSQTQRKNNHFEWEKILFPDNSILVKDENKNLIFWARSNMFYFNFADMQLNAEDCSTVVPSLLKYCDQI